MPTPHIILLGAWMTDDEIKISHAVDAHVSVRVLVTCQVQSKPHKAEDKVFAGIGKAQEGQPRFSLFVFHACLLAVGFLLHNISFIKNK